MQQSSLTGLFSGAVPGDFIDLLKAGTFVSKLDLQPGDIAEIVYEGDRKYVFIMNEAWMHHDPERTFSPKPVTYIHAINLAHISSAQLKKIIMASMFNDPKSAYGKIKPIVKSTRSYRTYLFTKVKRVRSLRYTPKENNNP